MKERPILFSTPMAQAILEGRKTQTRRIIKVQPDFDNELLCTITDTTGDKKVIGKHFWGHPNNDWNAKEYFSNPYGQVGNVLWVRETWCPGLCIKEAYAYKATFNKSDLEEGFNEKIKWKPSIFMPREACRIRLEITNIRVERLQNISEKDAIAEGITQVGLLNNITPLYENYLARINPRSLNRPSYINPIDSYHSLWEKINGKDSWNLNPWVWVIEFKKL